MRTIFHLTNAADGTTRRASFAHAPSWAELSDRASSASRIPRDQLLLSYIDVGGENIVLDSDEELQEYYDAGSRPAQASNASPDEQVVFRFTILDRAVLRPREDAARSACDCGGGHMPIVRRRPPTARSTSDIASRASQWFTDIAFSLMGTPEPTITAEGAAAAHAEEAQPSSSFLTLSSVPPTPPLGPLPTTFHCGICLEDQDRFALALVDVCCHEFCRDCIRQYIRTKTQEKQYPMPCPVCAVDLKASQLGKIDSRFVRTIGLAEKEYLEFQRLELSKFSVSVTCRRCKRSALVDRNEYGAAKTITCPLPRCNYAWCKKCNQSVACGGVAHVCDDGSTKLQALMDTHGWMYCPGCNTPASKVSGCNSMKCAVPGCNMRFCYRCKGAITQSVVSKEITSAKQKHYETCDMFQQAPEPRRRDNDRGGRRARAQDAGGQQPDGQRRGGVFRRLRSIFHLRRRAVAAAA